MDHLIIWRQNLTILRGNDWSPATELVRPHDAGHDKMEVKPLSCLMLPGFKAFYPAMKWKDSV